MAPSDMTDSSGAAALLPPARRHRGRLFLGAAVAAVSFALAIQMGLNANFMAEEIGVSGFQLGLIEAARETCGITSLLIIALLRGFAEPLVGSSMLVLFALGLSAYAFVPDFFWVVLMSLVWSQGLHVWMPLPQSMALALAEPGREGHRLGQLGAAGAAGFGAGLAVSCLLTWMGVPMRTLFLLGGAVALLAAGLCLGIPRDIRTPGPRLVARRRYLLYYVLIFIDGWRRQISLCFAGFLLVKVHHTSLSTILLLWCLVQVIGWLASPAVGRLIDRIGERPILVPYFAVVNLFFIGYATIPVKSILCLIMVIDSACFVFGMGLTTYVNRLTPPGERTPTLTMGVAVNHAAAVIMPLTGGLLWTYLGYQWAFAFGVVAGVAGIVAAMRLPQKACAHLAESASSRGTVLGENGDLPPDKVARIIQASK